MSRSGRAARGAGAVSAWCGGTSGTSRISARARRLSTKDVTCGRARTTTDSCLPRRQSWAGNAEMRRSQAKCQWAATSPDVACGLPAPRALTRPLGRRAAAAARRPRSAAASARQDHPGQAIRPVAGGLVASDPVAKRPLVDPEIARDLRDRRARLTPTRTAPSRNSGSNRRLVSFGMTAPRSACLHEVSPPRPPEAPSAPPHRTCRRMRRLYSGLLGGWC
jgi:hypothetical protein